MRADPEYRPPGLVADPAQLSLLDRREIDRDEPPSDEDKVEQPEESHTQAQDDDWDDDWDDEDDWGDLDSDEDDDL